MMMISADSVQHEVDNYYFKTELRTSHVVARHLWWYDAAMWPQEASGAMPTLVALSADDEIVPTVAVRATWGAAEMGARGVAVHTMPGLPHGGWLVDPLARQGLVRAAMRTAAAAPDA